MNIDSIDLNKHINIICTNEDDKEQQAMNIHWENLTVTAKSQTVINGALCFKKKNVEEKTILNNISGFFRPRTLTSILGPSGSGKTTLLNFLSNKLTSTNLSIKGKLQINGKEVKNLSQYQTFIGYVQQEDVLFPYFTPAEIFRFSLSLKKKNNREKSEEYVNSLLELLDLQANRDTKIDWPTKSQISKSERKKIAIGVELIQNPNLLFLDEPTTGLDSVTSYQILQILAKVAKAGRTVITTLHQPSSKLFKEFDQLMLLVEGNIIYQGDSNKAVDFFKDAKFECKQFMNPADYFINVMNPEGLLLDKLKVAILAKSKYNIEEGKEEILKEFSQRIITLRNHYDDSKQKKEQFEFHEQINQNAQTLVQDKSGVSFLIQLLELMKRNAKNIKIQILMTFVEQAFQVALLLILFNGLEEGRNGVTNRTGLFLTISLFEYMVGLMDVAVTAFQEKALFIREAQSKVYSPFAYFLAKNLYIMPFQMLGILFFTVSVWFGLGLESSGFAFGLLTIFATYQAAAAYGYFLSAIIPRFEVLIAVFTIVIVPFYILGGGLINCNDIPKYLIPLEYLSIPKYSFTANVQNIFEEIPQEKLFDPIQCSNYPNNICQPLAEQDFKETKWECIIAFLCLSVFFRFAAFLVLKKKSQPFTIKME